MLWQANPYTFVLNYTAQISSFLPQKNENPYPEQKNKTQTTCHQSRNLIL